MALLLFYQVAVLCAFLTSSAVSGFALPESGLRQSPNGIRNSLEGRDVAINETEGVEGVTDAEKSSAASTVITISTDQTITVTGFPPSSSAAAPSSLLSNSTIYTPPSAPFAISTRTGTRLFPTNAITTFATPTFVSTQTLIVTQTVTTLYVIDPTRTSTIIGYELAATVTTVTSVGYNCASTNAAPATATKVVLSGINLSGFETSCDTTGTCTLPIAQNPMSANYNITGQISHFTDLGFNTFRLPVSWQYLTNSAYTTTGVLNAANLAAYDALVQDCLNTGAYCVIDLHNYGRFSDYVIGQGGATDAAFVALWGAIAKKYAKESYVIFGLMNQISYGTSYAINSYGQSVAVTWNIQTWATTLQAAVSAIRTAGAISQFILLRGSDWTGTTSFVPATATALAAITNPDGPIGKLIFDFQKYLDSTGAGTSAECTSSYITDAFAPAAQWLRCHGRQALVTELGGGNTESCISYMCPVVDYLNANSDVFLGYIGWAAGTLASTYSLTPGYSSHGWVDQLLVQGCLKPSK
ncbi:glycoside hydrolase family 5 protein [Stipitochalara longipes BDJ]|nr:glycoside hydrolase family 5 protein [Stipitochalara longipes BDJ]